MRRPGTLVSSARLCTLEISREPPTPSVHEAQAGATYSRHDNLCQREYAIAATTAALAAPVVDLAKGARTPAVGGGKGRTTVRPG